MVDDLNRSREEFAEAFMHAVSARADQIIENKLPSDAWGRSPERIQVRQGIVDTTMNNMRTLALELGMDTEALKLAVEATAERKERDEGICPRIGDSAQYSNPSSSVEGNLGKILESGSQAPGSRSIVKGEGIAQ